MAQGDKRLYYNVRERLISDDFNRLQAIEAAEHAARLRAQYNDAIGDFYSASGLQTPYASTTPSLCGDVYGGLMVQPDNAGYFLIQPGVAGFLDPAGVGTDDNPYRMVNDPGVVTPAALNFTSNSGGGSPRWDVVECQPVDTVLAQESRFIFNPSTGIGTPTLVDKVKAGRLTYRVRVGTPGAGFPGLAVGWMPLAIVCAPTGSSSLLTSDVWDVRPLVRDRVRFANFSPSVACENRFLLSAVGGADQWIGSSESTFNGYQAGGIIDRSTPSTLAQFGATGVTGGRAGLFNTGLADNLSTLVLAPEARVNLAAIFPYGLPRWQRYSQTAVGSGRVPNGPRGILVATTVQPSANGIFSAAVPMPTAASFGAGSFSGCVLESAILDVASGFRSGLSSNCEHYTTSEQVAGTILGSDFKWDITLGAMWPPHARRVLLSFIITMNNTGGPVNPRLAIFVGQTTAFDLAIPFDGRVAAAVSASSVVSVTTWAPTLAKLLPTSTAYPATMRIVARPIGFGAGLTSATVQCLGWSASER